MGKQYLNGVLYGTGEIIKFSPYIYSLEEREVGVWTDGKPLYQKSFTTICLSVKTIIGLDDEVRVKNSAAFVTDSNGINYIPSGNVDNSDYVRISVNENGTFPSYDEVKAYYISKFSWGPNQDYYNYLKEYSMANPTYKIFLAVGTGAGYVTTIIANDIQSIGSNSCTCYPPHRIIWMNSSTATASDTAAGGSTFIPSYQTNKYIYFDDLNEFLLEFDISQNNCIFLENSYYLTHQNAYVTIQYTKTTDAPGSGKWTTMGASTVHYDDAERIIGTWFGETMYQKVIDVPSYGSGYTSVTHNLGIKNYVNAFGCCAVNGETDMMHNFPFIQGSNNCSIGVHGADSFSIYSSWNNCKAKICIQYTKATT